MKTTTTQVRVSSLTQSAIIFRLIQDFNYLKQKSPLYEITINPATTIHAKDLQFRMAKCLKQFQKMCFQSSFEYMFVIEYSQQISNGTTQLTTNRLGEHVHLIVHTDIGQSDLIPMPDNGLERLICFLNCEWEGVVHIDGKRIDGRTDLNNLAGYLSKQLHLMTRDNYNSNI